MVVVFAGALGVRLGYVALMLALGGQAALMGADSYGYFGNADNFVRAISEGRVQGWDWFGNSVYTMPLAGWLFACHAWLFGGSGPLAYVLMQCVVDAASCVAIFSLACRIDTRLGFAAGVLAALNPTQIVLAGLAYTDTTFVFFVALSLLGAVRWWREPDWSAVAILLLGLVGAAWTRVVIALWLPPLVAFLLAARWLASGITRRDIVQMLATCLAFGVMIAPIPLRNQAQYGHFSLSAQSGVYLAIWAAPLVREAADGTPYAKGVDDINRRMKERFPVATDNPFEDSRRYGIVGREALAEFPPLVVLKAWLFGATVNLASPAIILSPPVAQLPRTGFYQTAGSSLAEKVTNFLFRSDNARYAQLLALGLFGLALVRAVQAIGAFALLLSWRTLAPALLLLMWCTYILAVNGPIASPKYRLPLEPALVVFAAAGLCALRRGFDAARGRRPA